MIEIIKKKPIYKKVWFWIIALFFLISVISAVTGDENSSNTVSNNMNTIQEAKSQSASTVAPTPKPTLSPAEIAKKAEDDKINAEVQKVTDHKIWVDALFSPWDGSCKELVKLIKDNMNDPDSFKHVDTRFTNNKDDSVTIIMKYRGKNSFGGVVTEYVEAKADYKTNMISIVSQ